MKRTYGRVPLDAWGIDVLSSLVSDTLRSNEVALRAATDDHERAFYRQTAEWLDALSARFHSMEPGRTPFSETELRSLKGLVPTLVARLLAQYRDATLASDAHRAKELSDELSAVEALKASLDRPFLNDRSQNPEPDDEEDDREEDDDVAHPSSP
jgi:hypothetical protein